MCPSITVGITDFNFTQDGTRLQMPSGIPRLRDEVGTRVYGVALSASHNSRR